VSTADKGRHLRRVVCEGCSRRCRYEDFRAFGQYAGGFAPKWDDSRDYKQQYRRTKELRAARARGEKLPHGNAGRRHAGQQEFGQAVRDAMKSREKPTRKASVLGSMHEVKWKLWEEYINRCPLWGTAGTGGLDD
jgi:hypothetical protein